MPAPPAPLRFVIVGSSGFLGTHLVRHLRAQGHRVETLVRRHPRRSAGEHRWDPEGGTLDPATLEGADVVVNLAGESLDRGRWNEDQKRRILESRVRSTRLLATTLAGLRGAPASFLSTSAVGYYGDRGEEPLTEQSGPGSGFLADVCREWEAAADPARDAGLRVVHPRNGIVLDRSGGVLRRMLPPFRLGAGGVVGSGDQYWSWISLADYLAAVERVATQSRERGPVNLTAPEPVTAREFARTLGRVLRRPTLVPLPGFAVRAVFGEKGQALLLEGQRVLPARLQAEGFRFQHPGLEAALRAALGP